MDYFKQIKAYLEDDLTAEELERFEEELQNNKTLSDAVDNHFLEETEGVKDAVEQLKKSHWKALLADQDKGDKRSKRIRLFSIAAGILFLLSTGFVFWFANTTYSNGALSTNYYNPPNLTSSKGGIDVLNQLDLAKYAYETQNFEKVDSLLSSISSSDSLYLEAQYVMGCANFEKGRKGLAIPLFEIVAYSNYERKQTAEWYLLLSYLAIGEFESAQTGIRKILSTDNHIYSQKARELQKDLNSFWRKILF